MHLCLLSCYCCRIIVKQLCHAESALYTLCCFFGSKLLPDLPDFRAKRDSAVSGFAGQSTAYAS